MNKNDFYDVINEFTVLPGEVSELTKDAFANVLYSEKAKNVKNIVYVWRTKNKFQRFNGASDILYIGQTKNTFATRYGDFTKWIGTEANKLKLNHAIKEYGLSQYQFVILASLVKHSLNQKGNFCGGTFKIIMSIHH